jgi:hypothetical protein
MSFLRNSVSGMRGTLVLACLLAAVMCVPAGKAMAADDTMKFVAAPASVTKAGGFIGYMKKRGVATVDIVAPANAASVKKSGVVVIEGGMDDPAVKALITEVVGAAEAGPLAKDGAKKMFVKENMWQPGQKVLVFAGNNVESAAAARAENKDTWDKLITKWFDLEDAPEGLKGY